MRGRGPLVAVYEGSGPVLCTTSSLLDPVRTNGTKTPFACACGSVTIVRIKALPRGERPRERLQDLGPRSLSDAELVALVLGCGGGRESALEIARRLVAGAGGLRRLASLQAADLMSEPGIGRVRAAQLAAVFEIARRVRAFAPPRGRPIRSPKDVVRYLAARWSEERHECFGLMLLDSRNRILAEVVLSRGGWSASVVRPREVFRHALLAYAPAIILFHNHPSGDPTPSRADVEITKQLVAAGELLGINILDHLIVGVEGFASLRDRGLM